LYSILDYCEETWLCRRKLQLNFLGEPFEQAMCLKMCDNCNKQYNVEPLNVTKEALQIVFMINEFEKDGSNVTLKQAVDICKGRVVKTP
jgi:hypothetical protein